MRKLPVLFEGTRKELWNQFIEELELGNEAGKHSYGITFVAWADGERLEVNINFFTGEEMARRFKGHYGY